MLEPVKGQSGETDVMVPTSIVQPNSDGCFKVLIEYVSCSLRSHKCCGVVIVCYKGN